MLSVSSDTSVCQGEYVSLIASGDFITDYLWSTGDISAEISISSGGVYYVTASNICATVMDSVSLIVYLIPQSQIIADTAIFTGDSIQLWVSGNLTWDYFWSPDYLISEINIVDPIVNPDITTTYNVQITDSNFCFNQYYVTISVSDKPLPDLTIYNSFSPNDDGVNDFWVIENIEEYENSSLEIFNRNGNKVFSAYNYQNDWNGKYNDKDLPAHTYFFILDPGSGGLEIIKGHITIIR